MSQIYKTVPGGGAGPFIMTITGNDGTPNSPVANNMNLIGAIVPNGTNPTSPLYVKDTAPGTETIQLQYATAAASDVAANVGVSSFNSAQFTVSATGFVSVIAGGFQWIDEAASFPAVAETGYFVTANATATLPAAPAQGDTIEFVITQPATTLIIQATAGKFIRLGNMVSTNGGQLTSNTQGNTVELIFQTSSSTWFAVDNNGTWTTS